MALSASTIWEVETGGSDTANGGAFDPSQTAGMFTDLSRMFPCREALLNPLQNLQHCPWRRSFTAVVSRSRYHRRDGVLEAQSRQAVSWSREDGT